VNWNQIVETFTPYIVKIETPSGYGTGFLCLYNENKSLCGIATAYHVVRDTEEWKQPIRIQHYPSATTAFLSEKDRVIYYDAVNDSAVILLPVGELQLPETPKPLLPTDRVLSIGAEVGWLGFPAIVSNTLCFFSGNISAWQEFRRTYLIDGVAISGVSGGPVLYTSQTEGVQIVGTISAYRAGTAGGGTTPGLAFAQDVSHFHDVVGRVRSIDEANRKKQELEQTQQSTPAQEDNGGATTQPAEPPVTPPTERPTKA
jgi:hypothetical protein